MLFVGDKGRLLCEGAGGPPLCCPMRRRGNTSDRPTPAAVQGPPSRLARRLQRRSSGQQQFRLRRRLTELALLGVLSLRAGRKIDWDAANLKANNLPAADAFIKETYRPGWELA